MKLTDRQIEKIKRILDLIYRNKRTLVALSCVVVFITTYMLILPALTLEKDEAAEQGGISLETSATEEVTAEEAAGIGQDETAEIVHEKPMNDQSKDSDSAEPVKEPSDEVASSEKAEGDPDGAKTTERMDPLTFEGENFTIAVADEASVLPSGARIDVQEIIKDDEEYTEQYEELYTESLKALQKEEGKNKVADLGFAKFYDITLLDGETAIQPDSSVDVTIEYEKELQKELSAKNSENVRIIHFVQDEKTGELKPEILDSEAVEVNTSNKDKLTDTTFQADGFSVYAIVYTVDFHYEINGKKCDFGIPGGGFVSLEHLMQVLLTDADSEYDEAVDLNSINVSDTTKQFVEDVESVSFSAPDLVWVGKTETNTTVGALKDAHNLDVQYSADLTVDQIAEIDAQTVKAGDWALISLRPFDSEETLTVTMKNGDKFTVKVTDAREITDSSSSTIDVSKSYLICYQVGNTYYLLKNDGSVDSSHGFDDFESLNSTYCWTFNFVFEEKDREGTLTYNYYLIRPIDNKKMTIALNEEEEDLIQQSNNNIAVVPVEGGGFRLLGYNDIKLDFVNGEFVANDGDGIIVHIYEMDALPVYDYIVRSSDETRGTVSVVGGSSQTDADGNYILASSSHDKMNDGTITATPVDHKNTSLNPGDTGYNENKWEFDHWEQDGVPLDRDQYPATINRNTLPIPFNGSKLVAHFRQNPSYVVPDTEKNPSSFQDMTEWINGLSEKHFPLDEEATEKTAEVYDYENRIYRVDIASKANFDTFDGNIDLAFCMDVSNSMKFPSKLIPVQNDFSIYTINSSDLAKRQLDQTRNWGNPYYLIADKNDTSTVFKIYFKDGYWKAQDASREEEGDKSFRIGVDGLETTWTKGINPNNMHPFGAGDTDGSTYVIYDAGDNGLNRFHYLNLSFKSATKDLMDIRELLHVAGSQSPNVRIAFNTFNKELGADARNWSDFADAAEHDVNFTYSAGGGTRPDQAFIDANNNFHWSGDNRYVVLITDGAPQGNRTDSQGHVIGPSTPAGIRQEVIQQAQNLKTDKGVKFITIGLSMENVTEGKKLLYDLADTDKDGNKMFYLAESGSDLTNVLRHIIKTVMEEAIVYADVTDEVNDAFYPVDKMTGKPIKPGDMIDLEGRLTENPDQAVGVLQADGKTIKWLNQSIDQKNGWHGTIYVKAKEDLLGGNALRTNGDAKVEATKYHIGGKDYNFDESLVADQLQSLEVVFQTPRVNVNELSFLHDETEWTVYLGTSVDPKDQLRKLYDNILVEEVIKKGHGDDKDNDNLPEIGKDQSDNTWYPILPNDITDNREAGSANTRETFYMSDLLKKLAQGKNYAWWNYSRNEINWDKFLELAMTENADGTTGFTIPYNVYGITDPGSVITISLAKEIVDGEESDVINESPHPTTVEGAGVEKYTLTVRYSPDYDVLPKGQGGSGTVNYHTGTYGSMYQGHAAGTETSRNYHVINVFSKGLDITKTDEAFNNELTGAIFKLYRTARSTDRDSDKELIEGIDGQYVAINTMNMTEDGLTSISVKPVEQLAEGEKYYLVETKSPAGYNLLESPIEVNLNIEDTRTDIYEVDDEDKPTDIRPSNLQNWEQTADIQLIGSGAIRRTDAEGNNITNTGITPDSTNSYVYYQIANNPGYELPEAGGIGTTLFYIIGSLLVLSSVIYFVSRRRISGR